MGREACNDPRQVFGAGCGHRVGLVVLPQLGEFTCGNIIVRQQADFFLGPDRAATKAAVASILPSSALLIGTDVVGGLYGEMFPEREANLDGNGKIPLETSGADVLGQTSTERVLSEVCDWMEPGAGVGSSVFPGASSADIEPGVILSGLLSA